MIMMRYFRLEEEEESDTTDVSPTHTQTGHFKKIIFRQAKN